MSRSERNRKKQNTQSTINTFILAVQEIETRFYVYSDVTLSAPVQKHNHYGVTFSHDVDACTITVTATINNNAPAIKIHISDAPVDKIETITGLLVDLAKKYGGTCEAEEEQNAITLTAPALFPELYITVCLCLTGKLNFEPPAIDGPVVKLSTLNRPSWFKDPRFVAWLNDSDGLMTHHNKGDAPGEWSDIVVWVDSGLTGEGDASDMPEPFWREVVRAAAATNGGIASHEAGHFPVRITNIDSGAQ
tara:strand:+ start:5856 stop:6599 length:744 start_codon:yes stop_codon:yes gene_type:complete